MASSPKDVFLDDLMNEFAWRRKELRVLLNVVKQKKEPVLFKAGITMIYAHWEGFVKNSCELYLKSVSKLKLKHRDLKPHFIALSLKSKMPKLKQNDIRILATAVEEILGSLENKASISYKGVIHTRSNLKYDVFEEILFIIGIPSNAFSFGVEKKKPEDVVNDLVSLRNKIAHGEYIHIDVDYLEELHKYMDSLMYQMKTYVENAFVLEEYLEDAS